MYYGEVAEWSKASDCKSLQPLVRIQPSPPVFRASVTVAQQTPNLLDGVQFPGSEPNISNKYCTMTQPPRKIYPLQTTQAPNLVPSDVGIDPHVKLAEIYMAEHVTTTA